jgi:hypothetical protein
VGVGLRKIKHVERGVTEILVRPPLVLGRRGGWADDMGRCTSFFVGIQEFAGWTRVKTEFFGNNHKMKQDFE